MRSIINIGPIIKAFIQTYTVPKENEPVFRRKYYETNFMVFSHNFGKLFMGENC